MPFYAHVVHTYSGWMLLLSCSGGYVGLVCLCRSCSHTRWERVLCTGAASETCLLVSIRPLVAGTLSLCRSRNGTPRSAASPCRKPVARRLVWCPRSPAVARPWVDGQATVHRYAQAQEFLAKQRLFVHWILPTRKRDCNKILLTRDVIATIRPWQKGPSRVQVQAHETAVHPALQPTP